MTPPSSNMPEPIPSNQGEVLLYNTPGGKVRVEVFYPRGSPKSGQ